MDGVNTEVKELQKEVQEIKESVSFMSGKYDDVRMKLMSLNLNLKLPSFRLRG